MESSAERRKQLGAFLRARRERVTPEQVGLPPLGRRRTPGLRREEVAQLSGIGTTWYTWLEQGRATGVSDQVLEAVARVLRMTEAERNHLFVLADRAPSKAAPLMALRPEHTALLEQLLPFPAAVQTDAYEIVASNRADPIPLQRPRCAAGPGPQLRLASCSPILSGAAACRTRPSCSPTSSPGSAPAGPSIGASRVGTSSSTDC